MTTATANREYRDQPAPTMSRPVFVSLLVHGLILLIAIVGLPYITPKTPEIEEPIPIDVVTVADKSQVNHRSSTPVKANIPKPAPIKPMPKPVPPTNTTQEPPKPAPPTPPTPLKSETAPAEDALAPPDKVIKKPKTPPKKPVKPTETKPDEKTKDQQQDFNALLKNMIKSDPTAANATAPVDDKATPTPDATLSDQMTMSEMDAVRQQLGQCWKLLAGARYAEDLVVEIDMTMNADKTVAAAKIVDQGRYNSDTFFRAAADSAQRAVYDPHCNPLTALPDGKYSMWKDLDVKFDPREMLQ